MPPWIQVGTMTDESRWRLGHLSAVVRSPTKDTWKDGRGRLREQVPDSDPYT